MIAYKWVVKQNNEFIPLVNFGINHWMNKTKAEHYQLNKVYNNVIDYDVENEKKHFNLGRERPGYHFWKSSFNETYFKHYQSYLKNYRKITVSFTTLCCILENIIWEDREKFIALQFTPIKILESK
jgi:hypothetical protein